MNPRQLEKIGVSSDCIPLVISGIQKAAKDGSLRTMNVKTKVKDILDKPEAFTEDTYFSEFAKEVIVDREFIAKEPIGFSAWGNVDDNVKPQMEQLCAVPSAVKVSLMADAHFCNPIPVGSVVALEDAISPTMVGPDISCMMKMSVLDMPAITTKTKFNLYKEAIDNSTRFGFDEHDHPQNHPVLDENWNITRVTKDIKDKAHRQLGSSGSGNHFCDVGIVSFSTPQFGLDVGQYVAVLTHSGSRGSGAAVYDLYDSIARKKRAKRYDYLGKLSWLEKGTSEFYEYWQAMNLMGQYASANHDVIHRLMAKNLGAEVLFSLENRHNFAWSEQVDGKEVYVHRKGATPAASNTLGIIPGSMASPAFIVSGKGNEASINSASHGAGRLMSRRAAKEKYNWKSVKNDLAEKGIMVLAAGADEVPYAYKNIEEVMAQQTDLVDVLGRFDPRIVKMADE
jgi:tRNA-splicing ligase RtcB